MPRVRGQKNDTTGKKKAADAIRMIERGNRKRKAADEQIEKGMAMLASVDARALIDISAHHRRRVALMMSQSSEEDVSPALTKKRKGNSPGKKNKSRRNASQYTLKSVIPRSMRQSDASSFSGNNKENNSTINEDNKKRKYVFRSKVLAGGKAVPMEIQIKIVQTLFVYKGKGEKQYREKRLELIKKYKDSYPVMKKSISMISGTHFFINFRVTAEEKKMKHPNVLPQRAKLLVGGTPRGSTTPIVLVMRLKKSEFTNKENGPFIEKFSFISKDTGPNAQVCLKSFLSSFHLTISTSLSARIFSPEEETGSEGCRL